jgi:aminoglycoside/choline kinase family phosphotransferase
VGSNTYDLCSLLKDAYLELSANDLQTLLNYYYTQASIDTEFSQFEEQFEQHKIACVVITMHKNLRAVKCVIAKGVKYA